MIIISKKSKSLSVSDMIEFLELMKTETLPFIAKKFSISVRAAQYHKRKYYGFTEEEIDREKSYLQRQLDEPMEHKQQNYRMQERCDHSRFTLFLRCNCSLILSEKDLDRVIDILLKRKETITHRKRIEVVI